MNKAECILTTEKDAIKLSGVIGRDFPIVSLGIGLKITKGNHFRRLLLDLLMGPAK